MSLNHWVSKGQLASLKPTQCSRNLNSLLCVPPIQSITSDMIKYISLKGIICLIGGSGAITSVVPSGFLLIGECQ